MTARIPSSPKKFELKMIVSTEEQARELDAAW